MAPRMMAPETRGPLMERAVMVDGGCYLSFGTTSIGQDYILFLKPPTFGGVSVYLSTASMRNTPIAIEPIKISSCTLADRSEGLSVIMELQAQLERFPLFALNELPQKVEKLEIPISRELISLHEIPAKVLRSKRRRDEVLVEGDELFVQCGAAGVTFYHSGIYAGDGMVYHFLNKANEPGSSSLAGFFRACSPLPGRVCCEKLHNFIYALNDESSPVPPVYRVSYALRVRTKDSIIRWAKFLQKTKVFSQYDIRYRNCQHFSSMCSIGLPFSYDMDNHLKFLACSIFNTKRTKLCALSATSTVDPPEEEDETWEESEVIGI